MVVVGGDNIKTLVEKAEEYPLLKYVVSIDTTVPEDVAAMAKEKNIELRTFDQVIVSNTICCMINDILLIRNLVKRMQSNIRFVYR